MSTSATDAATPEYEKMLGELATLEKAMSVAPDDNDADGGADPQDTERDPDEDRDEEGGEAFGKSFRVQLEDGTVTEAYDGTQMMKALHDTQESHAGIIAAQHKAIIALGEGLGRANDMLKSMAADLRRIGGQGQGRQAVVNIHQRPSTTPAAPKQPSRGDILAKAETAHRAGKVTAQEVARVEAYLNEGAPLPPDLQAAVDAAG